MLKNNNYQFNKVFDKIRKRNINTYLKNYCVVPAKQLQMYMTHSYVIGETRLIWTNTIRIGIGKTDSGHIVISPTQNLQYETSAIKFNRNEFCEVH